MRLAFDDKFDLLASTLRDTNFQSSERACEDLLRTLHDKLLDKLS